MKDSLDVVTIDEAMAMFVTTQTDELTDVEQFVKYVTGAELNVAAGLARLSLKVGWVSRISNDSFGCPTVKSLEKEGIDAQGATQDGHYTTGFQLKSRVENGTDPIVEYFRKSSAASYLSIEDYCEAYFANARHLHLSGVAVALSASSYELLTHAARTMKAQEKTTSFDPNLHPVLWKSEAEMVERLSRLTLQTDWILPRSKKGMTLTGQRASEAIADFYLRHGVKAMIVKTGTNDAWYKTANGEQDCVAPVKVDNVVDTVGAGDGFVMGVISVLLEGRSLHQAVTHDNKIGTLAAQIQDDSEGLPTRERLGE